MKLEICPARKSCCCKHGKVHTIARGGQKLVVKASVPVSSKYGYCIFWVEMILKQEIIRIGDFRVQLGRKFSPRSFPDMKVY